MTQITPVHGHSYVVILILADFHAITKIIFTKIIFTKILSFKISLVYKIIVLRKFGVIWYPYESDFNKPGVHWPATSIYLVTNSTRNLTLKDSSMKQFMKVKSSFL